MCGFDILCNNIIFRLPFRICSWDVAVYNQLALPINVIMSTCSTMTMRMRKIKMACLWSKDFPMMIMVA